MLSNLVVSKKHLGGSVELRGDINVCIRSSWYTSKLNAHVQAHDCLLIRSNKNGIEKFESAQQIQFNINSGVYK